MLYRAGRAIVNVGSPSETSDWRRPAPPQHRARVAAELAKLIVNGATFMKLVRALSAPLTLRSAPFRLRSTAPWQSLTWHGGFDR